MSRNTLNSQYNKTAHDEDTFSEDSLRAQHAALAKMAEAPQPVASLAPPAPIAPTAPLVAPSVTVADAMQHPAFHGIMNALRRPQVPSQPKIAKGLRTK